MAETSRSVKPVLDPGPETRQGSSPGERSEPAEEIDWRGQDREVQPAE
jgi:hypothetical protein